MCCMILALLLFETNKEAILWGNRFTSKYHLNLYEIPILQMITTTIHYNGDINPIYYLEFVLFVPFVIRVSIY